MLADLGIMINAVLGVLMAFILFTLKDIKEDIKTTNAAILDHHSNADIHCAKDKFKINHVISRG
jgi:hypothetical protein